jgi:DNA-binding NarL/FixJ family response regulator
MKTIKIVLADDQQLVREGLALLLDLFDDLEVVGEAVDGKQAIEEVKKHKPDVVLMDIQMPELDGVAATTAIQEIWPESKVIILTTFDDDEYVFEGLRAGAVGYLLKDVPSEQLAGAIRAAAKGEGFIQPSIAGKVLAEFARIGKQERLRKKQPLSAPLSQRELEVLAEMATGASNHEIADNLFIAVGTVKNHVSNIIAKLETRDRAQAVLKAKELGYI